MQHIIQRIMTDVGTFLASHPELVGQMFMEEMQRSCKTKSAHRRSAPRNRNKGYALEEMDILRASKFKRTFRLNREAFYWLLLRIRNDIEPKASLKHRFHFDRDVV